MIDKLKVKTILFVTLSNLGDIVLTTPVLEKLCDEFPAARIDVITGEPGREIFSRHSAVREIIVRKRRQNLSERLLELIRLRRKKYDLVIDLKNSLLPYLAGSRAGSFFSFILSARHAAKHKKDVHLLKLLSLGIDPFRNNKFFIPVTDDEKKNIERIMGADENKKIVVINPGSKSHLKRWPAEKYAELADRIALELGQRIVLVGGREDKEVVQKVSSLMKAPYTDLSAKTSLGELFELMKNARLVITNDSAPLHVASAAGAPTVAIFGPSDDAKYAPLSPKNTVIKPEIPCRPCSKALCAVGPEEGCIGRVEVDEVFKAVKRFLD